MALPPVSYTSYSEQMEAQREIASIIKLMFVLTNGFGRRYEPGAQPASAAPGDAVDDGRTFVDFTDSSGNLLGSFRIDGNPFALGGGVPTTITNLTVLDSSGSPVVGLAGFAPLTVTEFEAKFLDIDRSSSSVFDDFVALTNGGAVATGGTGSDTFHMGTGPDTVTGGDGNDTLHKSAAGYVNFIGGAGIDTLSFVGQGSSLFPNPFVQTMVVNLASGKGLNPYGGKLSLSGVENVIGTSAADIITGNGRANVIGDGFVDGGADTVKAGGGDDIVNVVDLALIHADGGTGFDTFRFLGSIDLQDPDFASRVVNFEKFEIFRFFIGPPPSTMRGDAGANWFAADDGNDTLQGRGGNDTLDGGKAFNNDFTPGADVAQWSGDRARYTITAEGGILIVTDTRPGSPDGTDWVANIETLRFKDKDISVAALFPKVGQAYFGTSGDNGFGVPSGSAKNASAWGYGGDDTLDGRDGKDRLFGGAGNDSLTGGLGDDRLEGGTGDDIYVIGFGRDEVVERAGEGIDSIVLESSSPKGSFSLAGHAAIENLEARNFIPMALTGNALDNRITSSNGADTLKGGGGDDTLTAEFGSDILYGGDGNDVLDGGYAILDRGEDLMFGGAGRDVFVFRTARDSTPLAVDLIADFNTRATDLIDLSAIDAIAGGTDDAFTFVGGAAFAGLGQVRVHNDGFNTFIDANVTGTTDPEMRIQLTGLVGIGAADLIL